MARTLGAQWAERVARDPAHRSREWPTDGKALGIAQRKVSTFAKPGHVEALANACVEGAAEWWRGRPERYR